MLFLISGFCLHCVLCSCINGISIVGLLVMLWHNICAERMRRATNATAAAATNKWTKYAMYTALVHKSTTIILHIKYMIKTLLCATSKPIQAYHIYVNRTSIVLLFFTSDEFVFQSFPFSFSFSLFLPFILFRFCSRQIYIDFFLLFTLQKNSNALHP